jgi:hypothetical protein
MQNQHWLFEAPLTPDRTSENNYWLFEEPLSARENPLCQPNRQITHGGLEHRARIARIVDRMCYLGWKDIRVDRQQIVEQMTVAGKLVKRLRNRPDVSGINPKTGKRVHIEIDTRRDRSKAHERRIVQNDPNVTSTYVVIQPGFQSKQASKKGIAIEGRTYKPGKRTTVPRVKL